MKSSTSLLFSLMLLATTSLMAGGLKSTPETFDFGWSPEDARLTCEFTIANDDSDAIMLQALKPACGCTAAQFSPMSLASSQDTKIGLTFNTRGYKGIAFNKSAELTTGENKSNLVVYLRGHALNPAAMVHPIGNGIASFEPGMKKSAQEISIQNKTASEVTLNVIQAPASWASIKLEENVIKPGDSIESTIQVSGSFETTRETSATFEATEGANKHRFTIAIRTGAPAKAYQPIRPLAPTSSQPDKSNGFNDPLKLKGIDPVKK